MRRVSASDANTPSKMDLHNRRSKPMFPMTHTARATLEIGSSAVCWSRGVTTTPPSNQERRPPQARLLRTLHVRRAPVLGGGGKDDELSAKTTHHDAPKNENNKPRGQNLLNRRLDKRDKRRPSKSDQTDKDSTRNEYRSDNSHLWADNVDNWYNDRANYSNPLQYANYMKLKVRNMQTHIPSNFKNIESTHHDAPKNENNKPRGQNLLNRRLDKRDKRRSSKSDQIDKASTAKITRNEYFSDNSQLWADSVDNWYKSFVNYKNPLRYSNSKNIESTNMENNFVLPFALASANKYYLDSGVKDDFDHNIISDLPANHKINEFKAKKSQNLSYFQHNYKGAHRVVESAKTTHHGAPKNELNKPRGQNLLNRRLDKRDKRRPSKSDQTDKDSTRNEYRSDNSHLWADNVDNWYNDRANYTNPLQYANYMKLKVRNMQTKVTHIPSNFKNIESLNMENPVCRVVESFEYGKQCDIKLREKYRQQVGTKLRVPTMTDINPRNVRPMTIGQPLSQIHQTSYFIEEHDKEKLPQKSIKKDAKRICSNEIDSTTNLTSHDVRSELKNIEDINSMKSNQLFDASTKCYNSSDEGKDITWFTNPFIDLEGSKSQGGEIELTDINPSHSRNNNIDNSFAEYVLKQQKLLESISNSEQSNYMTITREYEKEEMCRGTSIPEDLKITGHYNSHAQYITEQECSKTKVQANKQDENTTKSANKHTTKQTSGAGLITNPEVEHTTNPELEHTTNPEDEHTRNPEVKHTINPELEHTTNPEDEHTTNPEVERTTNPEVERSTKSDRIILTQLPNNALFLTLPKPLVSLSDSNVNTPVQLLEIENNNDTKPLVSENNRPNIVKKKRQKMPPEHPGSSDTKNHEVDSSISFSCITTPEVVSSCNTTSSTAQSVVAVDLKPSSVISSSFNGLLLSRSNYGSTGTSTSDDYKKSSDENGNSVQGFSPPLSGYSQHKKPRRKKSSKNETVIDCQQIDGYQGDKDVNELLRFIESKADNGRATKLGRVKHKDDSDDKSSKKCSTERRKGKENKIKRASSLEELSHIKIEDLTDVAESPLRGDRESRDQPAKVERCSWGDDAIYRDVPDTAAAAELTDFQTVTKKRKPRRRSNDVPPRRRPNDVPPRRAHAPSARRQESAPPSERFNDSNDDMDSVHSLPAAPQPAPPPPPQMASYADITRMRHNIPDLI